MSTLPGYPISRRSGLFLLSAAAAFSFTSVAALAAEPSGFFVEKTEHGATVKLNGEFLTNFVVDQANKPYFWPVIGPTGKAMTRAFPMENVEGEVKDHPHHRGIWIGHESINGIDTWTEAATYAKAKPEQKEAHLSKIGSIRHREFTELKGDAKQAVIASVDDFIAPDGKTKTLEMAQRETFHLEGDARVIDFEFTFKATEGPVEFGDAKDAGFNVRMANSIAVESKEGGEIINSEGVKNADAWGKRAKWVDYHGPLAGETVGIAIFDHPQNFRYPTPWHVRTYGLFTVNPFGLHSLDKTAPDGTLTLKKGEELRLRYRLIMHKGDEKAAHIAEAFEKYAAEAK